MTKIRQPRGDCLAESPQDWQDIPLGAGQEPNARADGLQWTKEGDPFRMTDVRRKPGEDTAIVQHRWPQAPA